MVTALNEAIRLRARRSGRGPTIFLTKPVNKVELLCRIQESAPGQAPQEPARPDARVPGRGRDSQPGREFSDRVCDPRSFDALPSGLDATRKIDIRWPVSLASSSGRRRGSPVLRASSLGLRHLDRSRGGRSRSRAMRSSVVSYEGQFIARGSVQSPKRDPGPTLPLGTTRRSTREFLTEKPHPWRPGTDDSGLLGHWQAPKSASRLVFSESDGLSGLTVDRFDRWLVGPVH